MSNSFSHVEYTENRFFTVFLLRFGYPYSRTVLKRQHHIARKMTAFTTRKTIQSGAFSTTQYPCCHSIMLKYPLSYLSIITEIMSRTQANACRAGNYQKCALINSRDGSVSLKGLKHLVTDTHYRSGNRNKRNENTAIHWQSDMEIAQ